MKTVAFFNNKGGVGKTTLICNVAAFLGAQGKRVLLVDADPQCNASQYILPDRELKYYYSTTSTKTIYEYFKPLTDGKDYGQNPVEISAHNFHLSLIAGDPRLALVEDLLAKDWGATLGGETRGARTSIVFFELFQRFRNYDLILVDMGPALSSINRAVLIGADYFVSPMSSDLFSSKAIENIAAWYKKWHAGWDMACKHPDLQELELTKIQELTFAGYVTQQYVAKRQADGGIRPVKAFEEIISPVEKIITDKFKIFSNKPNRQSQSQIGTIPNLFSLVPMSQKTRKPIFELTSADGVRGAHFTKVKEAKDIFKTISSNLIQSIE